MRSALACFVASVCLVACGTTGGQPAAPTENITPPVASAPVESKSAAAVPPAPASASAEAASDPPAAPPPTGPKLGADRDAHGCIGSAGYAWSEIRKSCVRLFEVGLRLDPVPPPKGNEATLSAFLVFAADDRAPAKNDSVELFVPGTTGGALLLRDKKATSYAKEGSAFKAKPGKLWTIEKDGKPAFAQAR